MAGTLYLGTSGFGYDEWKGPFYPEKLKQREMLPFYASRFNSVEINYTFRQQPTEKTLATWRDVTPEGFAFTLKAHQRITHWLRLAGADEAVSAFLDRAKMLGPRLGTILFQCPPNLPYDRQLIEAFLGYLPPTFRYAFEFRHPSWSEARSVLASQGAAWCVAETDESPVPGDFAIPPVPFSYLRLRKTRYEDDELKAWAERIGRVLAQGSDVYCYFKHEEKGAGPVLAERLQTLLPDPESPG
jgi:uncharacterized protein YecE (DUF72 family)